MNDFILDYISAKSGTPSGYGSLGVAGGDGSLDHRAGAAFVDDVAGRRHEPGVSASGGPVVDELAELAWA